MDEEKKQETPQGEASAPETPEAENVETANNTDVAQLINDVKTEYEAKISKLTANYNDKLAERDKVIKQLLTEESVTPEPSIADKINIKRNYKKW